MKRLFLICLLLMIIFSGCRKEVTITPPMRYDTAVVHVAAVAVKSEATAPVSKNYGLSANGERTGYGASLTIEDRIEVKYDFIGRGEYVIADTKPQEWTDGDVYIFNIIIGTETTVVPIIFKGQSVKVYESDDFTVTIK